MRALALALVFILLTPVLAIAPITPGTSREWDPPEPTRSVGRQTVRVVID